MKIPFLLVLPGNVRGMNGKEPEKIDVSIRARVDLETFPAIRCKSLKCYVLAEGSWASHITSLNLSFINYKIKVIKILILQGFWKVGSNT